MTNKEAIEKDGDRAISQNAVLAELDRWIGYLYEDMIGRIQIGIKRLPPVTPKDVPDTNVGKCGDAISREQACNLALNSIDKSITANDIMRLPPVKPQPCEDAISRILKRMWNCRGKYTTSIDKVKMEQIIRDELASHKLEPKTGHWISTLTTAVTNNGITLDGVVCSGCNKITYITDKTPLRCPWCDMDM